MESSVDLSQDQGPFLRRLTIAMVVLPTVSLLIRIWSRSIAPKTKFWWDDWLAVGSWICCVTCAALFFRIIALGMGKHVTALHPATNIYAILKVLYASPMVFDVGIMFAKFSALAFYMRVLSSTKRSFKMAVWSTAALVVAFIIFRLLVEILSCIPPRKMWEPETPGHCNGTFTNFYIYIAGAVLDAATDLIILMLPVPVIARLQMKPSRKWMVIGALACGYATVITSIGRMVSVIQTRSELQSKDITYYEVSNLAWSQAEISISVLSICIPSWFYLVKRASQHGIASLLTTRDQSISPGRVIRGGPNAKGLSDGFTRLQGETSASAPSVHSEMSRSQNGEALHDGPERGADIELGSVGVRKDIYVAREDRG